MSSKKVDEFFDQIWGALRIAKAYAKPLREEKQTRVKINQTISKEPIIHGIKPTAKNHTNI